MDGCVDIRLVSAYQKISQGKVSLLSLDIFDTLLRRKVPQPKDLFLLLGQRLKREGWLIPAVTAEGFADLRFQAEKKARGEKAFSHRQSEVKISEIYWRMVPLFVPLTLEQMLAGSLPGIFGDDVTGPVEMEVALEKEMIFFDQAILRLLMHAKEKQLPVVLVSDTYFEENHIHDFLGKIHVDRLYLSSEYGVRKSDGLFNYLLQEWEIPPKKILHIGDHAESDLLAGKTVGLTSIHYPKQDKDFEGILKKEGGFGAILDETQGDFGFTALRSKTAFHPQLSSLPKESHFFWRYGATILGPILFGFIHWIYERCRALNKREVFCLMREGKLYAELIGRFAPYYPEHCLEAKELWVSRPFTAHAAIYEGKWGELAELMKTFVGQFTIEHFCHYLGLNVEDMDKWSSHRHMVLDDSDLRRRFLHDVLRRKGWKQAIIQSAKGKRDRFLSYFNSLIQDKSSPLILIDIGWTGTIQSALRKILISEGFNMKLHGLYLGTSELSNEGLLEGCMREGFLFRGGRPIEGHSYKRGCFVFEQAATAKMGVGPLFDIDEKGKIITHATWISPQQQKEVEWVQQGIFAFFDEVGSYVKSGAICLDSQSDALQQQLRSIFLRLMTHTTRKEALKFGKWRHEHGPTQHLTQVIGKDPYYDDFIQDIAPASALKEGNINWPSAYTAKKSDYLTLATQAVWLEQLPARCFLSEDQIDLRVYLDTGKNFSARAHQKLTLRSNPNRRFYGTCQLFAQKKTIRKIQLKLFLPHTLIRIHSLRFLVYDRKNRQPEELIFFENDLGNLVMEGGSYIDHQTLLAKKELKLTHHFQSPQTYHVKMRLCCETFKFQ